MIARELETFRTSRLLDFASPRELTGQIGHPPALWPQVVVKELVDNALDAAEQIGIAPELRVTVGPEVIEVADNGPGIGAEVIDAILDFTVRVSSREAYVGPTRGAQGNALKTILAMPFALDGQAGLVEVESRGVRHRIALAIDPIAQEPRAEVRREPSLVRSGTCVRLHWPLSASSILNAALPAIRHTVYKFALFNPHLRLAARLGHGGDKEEEVWEPTDPAWRRWRPSDPAPAHWYDLPRFERLVAALIHLDRGSGRVRTVRELVARFRGLSGTAKQKAILAGLGLARASLEELVGPDGALDRGLLDRLLATMQAASRPPRAEALGIIGREHLLARLSLGEVGRESFTYRQRVDDDPLAPRVAEIGFAFDEDHLPRRLLLCGLNNSAALAEAGAFRELGRDGLGGLLGEQYAGPEAPVALVLHLTGARLVFTDRGKSAVSF